MKTLDNTNFDSETVNGVVLVDFYADWCPPCRAMTPVVEDLAQTYSAYKVNIDDSPEIAQKYNIAAIPTFIVLNNGIEVERIQGVISKQNLKDILDKHESQRFNRISQID